MLEGTPEIREVEQPEIGDPLSDDESVYDPGEHEEDSFEHDDNEG